MTETLHDRFLRAAVEEGGQPISAGLFLAECGKAESSALALIPLLREYTQTFQAVGAAIRKAQNACIKARDRVLAGANESDVRNARADNEYQNIQFTVGRLKPAADDLIRQASQLVEHGNLGPVTRIELALRLAEFESAVRLTTQRLAHGPTG